jgi:hypothetical protein
MPDNAATCAQSLFTESFVNDTLATPRFASLSPTTQPWGTTWLIADGVLQSAATLGYAPQAVAYATSTAVFNWQGAFTYTLNVMTDYQAGLAFNIIDQNNYYSFYLGKRSARMLVGYSCGCENYRCHVGYARRATHVSGHAEDAHHWLSARPS